MILLGKRTPQMRGYLIGAYKEEPGRFEPLVKNTLIQVYVKTWKREAPLVKVNYVRENINLEDLHTAVQMIIDDVKHGE